MLSRDANILFVTFTSIAIAEVSYLPVSFVSHVSASEVSCYMQDIPECDFTDCLQTVADARLCQLFDIGA